MHVCHLRVRTYECDNYGHVNNAVYLNYLEYARQELIRDEGINYFEMIQNGTGIFISEVQIQYVKGALADDELEIRTTPKVGGAAFGVFQQEIYRGEELIAKARVTWVCVDARGKPKRVPEELKKTKFISKSP